MSVELNLAFSRHLVLKLNSNRIYHTTSHYTVLPTAKNETTASNNALQVSGHSLLPASTATCTELHSTKQNTHCVKSESNYAVNQTWASLLSTHALVSIYRNTLHCFHQTHTHTHTHTHTFHSPSHNLSSVTVCRADKYYIMCLFLFAIRKSSTVYLLQAYCSLPFTVLRPTQMHFLHVNSFYPHVLHFWT